MEKMENDALIDVSMLAGLVQSLISKSLLSRSKLVSNLQQKQKIRILVYVIVPIIIHIALFNKTMG